MRLTRRAALDGMQLDEVHEAIVIRSINPGTPKESTQTASLMGYAGQRMTMQHWDSLEASVTYAINIPKRQIAERRAVFDMVNAWAVSKGWLTMTGMTGKRMRVDHVVVPNSGDLWNWTGEFTITFQAYAVPFWQDDEPVEVTEEDISTGDVWIDIPGNVKTVLDVSFENTGSGTIENFEVTADGNTLTLNGVNLGAGQTLQIDHTEDGRLRVRKGSTSVYNLMTGSDDLHVAPKYLKVSVNASGEGDLTLSCNGRYL